MKNNNIYECVIAKIDVDGKKVLTKNRDRNYKPKIEIVHELVNGIEICYLHDLITDWSEGMNEFGIGVVNSALLVDYDQDVGEKAEEIVKKDDHVKALNNIKDLSNFKDIKKTPILDGIRMRKALSKNNIKDCMRTIINYVGGVKGHCIISDKNDSYILEITRNDPWIIKKIKTSIEVRTNHGIEHVKAGYENGIKRKSSESRLQIAKEKLENVKDINEILPILAGQYNDNNMLNPYRRSNKYKMETTSQILCNLTDLELIVRHDINKSIFKGYNNKLPKDYKPKIKVFIKKVE